MGPGAGFGFVPTPYKRSAAMIPTMPATTCTGEDGFGSARFFVLSDPAHPSDAF